jgi:adenylate cyclase
MSTDALALKERELKLVLALDDVRDMLEDGNDPHEMFHRIANLLKSTFEADAAAVMLVAETSDDIDSLAAVGLPSDTAAELCREAMKLEHPAPIKTSLWAYTLGAQIILDKEKYPLGGIIVGRKSRPFAKEEIAMLDLAESQIDSAVMQARTHWKLAHRNRELEAIFQIDRLRDDTNGESELISGFTTILVDNFKADLCMIILSHVDSGELIVRGVVDKHDLPATALDAIRDLTSDIRIPQVVPTPPGIEGLTLLAAPFIVSGSRLGAVVIGRKSSFSIADHRLLFAMTSQMDSAVVHSRINQQLNLRNRELETIYRIDQIRDRENELDNLLQEVVKELCRAVSSEVGYLMLYDEKKEEPLEMKASTTGTLLTSPEYQRVISRVSREALNAAQLIYNNAPEGPVRSIVAIPLILNTTIIGVFGAVNSSNPRGFTAEDRRMLTAITSQVDTAVFERLERRRMRKVLSRSVDPKVLEHLLQRADDTVLTGERVVLSVLFADLRGSTEWAERTMPEELVTGLNAYLSKMTDVIFKYGGTLDKFVGDEVIGLFGSPIVMPDHALRAAQCALEMQKVHSALQAEMVGHGTELPAMGVGVSSGEVIAGEFGPPIRTDFTAMGRVMNLGARLCSAAKGGEVVISPATYHMLREKVEVEKGDSITLKGIGQPLPLFRLVKVKDDAQ